MNEISSLEGVTKFIFFGEKKQQYCVSWKSNEIIWIFLQMIHTIFKIMPNYQSTARRSVYFSKNTILYLNTIIFLKVEKLHNWTGTIMLTKNQFPFSVGELCQFFRLFQPRVFRWEFWLVPPDLPLCSQLFYQQP